MIRQADLEIDDTVDPRILALISWLYAERRATHGQLIINTHIHESFLTGERTAVGSSNQSSVDARISAIDAAIQSARQLISQAGIDVKTEIQTIKATLPDVSPELSEPYPIDVAVAEDQRRGNNFITTGES